MGIYRFILAVLVALSHTGLTILGFNQGVVAVISFYLLCGFTMDALFKKYYSEKSLIKYFYIDRAFRIFPQYIFYLIITLVFASLFSLQTDFLKDINLVNVIENVVILPLGYYMFNDLQTCLIIPPAWSLGLEWTFYLIFPFISSIKNSKKVLSVFSAGIFVLAYFGLINTDWFGYRLLPGVLFVFLAGSIMKNNDWEKHKKMIFAVWCVCVVLFINIYVNVKYMIGFNKEVLLGIIIGIPVILYLKNVKVSKLDNFWGNLSYGVFLNHFFVMYTMSVFTGHMPENAAERIFMTVISSILAYATYEFVEKPFMIKRRLFRKRVLGKEANKTEDRVRTYN